MSKSFQIRGLDKVLGKLDKISAKGIRLVQTELQAVSNDIAVEARENAPGDFGPLGQSYSSTPSNNDLTATISSYLKYAPYVEFGTRSKVQIPAEFADLAAQFRGGTGGTFKDLLEKIKAWCNKKNIPEDAAYPIALKIAKEGTEAKPHFIPAFIRGRQRLIENLERGFSDIAKNQ